jgi:hypothetical protein
MYRVLVRCIDCFVFKDGLCLAKDKEANKWGYIDKAGNWIIAPEYDNASEFINGYATVNNIAVIDTNGKVVLSLTDTQNN